MKKFELNGTRAIIIYSGISVILLGIIIWLACDYVISKKNYTESASSTLVTVNGVPEKLYDDDAYITVKVNISTEMLEEELRNISKLITEEYYFTQVETYEKVEELGFVHSTSRIIYSYDGVVAAGVPTDKIKISVNEDTKTVTITIPKSTIQYVTIDFDSFKKLEEKQGIWSKIRLDDVNKSLVEFKESATAKAEEKGILQKADENAEAVIKQTVNSLVDSNEYEVKFIHE